MVRNCSPTGAALVALTIFGVAHAEVPTSVLLSIRRSRLEQGLAEVSAALAEHPDEADLHAAHGVLLSRLGWSIDANTAFELSLGSTYYERFGHKPHANALRLAGRVDEAVALRQSGRLGPKRNDDSDLATLIQVMGDYAAVGRFDEALDVGDELIGMSPDGPLVWAALVELHLDRDDIPAAALALQEAKITNQRFEVDLAEARFYAQLGDHTAALTITDSIKRKRKRHPRLAALRARLMREAGLHQDALDLLQGRIHGNSFDPTLRAEELRCLIAAGRLDDARQLGADLRAYYPSLIEVQAALSELDAATP